MNPAQVAQMLGVAESDVDREPRSRRSQGQEDRHAVARAEVARSKRSSTRERRVRATRPRTPARSKRRTRNAQAAQPKFACPACGGEAVWNPAKAELVCPFCGTESPAPLDARRRDRRARSRRGAARDPRRSARLAQPTRARCRCQSCNAISVLDPARQAQNCEFCGSAQLVAVRRRRSRRSGPRACCRSAVSEAQARDGIRAWYGKLWLAPTALKRRALTDTVRRRLPAVLDVRRAGRRAMDRGGRPLLLHDRNVRRERPDAHAPGAARALGARGRARCRISSTTISSARRSASHPGSLRGIEPFPTQDAEAVRRGLRRRLGRRALPDRPRRRRAARARRDGRQAAGAVRAADSRRHVPQPRRPRRLLGADVQAHPRAGLAADLHATAPARFQCVMNGVTGAIRGEYPKSPWKIALLVLADLHRRGDRACRWPARPECARRSSPACRAVSARRSSPSCSRTTGRSSVSRARRRSRVAHGSYRFIRCDLGGDGNARRHDASGIRRRSPRRAARGRVPRQQRRDDRRCRCARRARACRHRDVNRGESRRADRAVEPVLQRLRRRRDRAADHQRIIGRRGIDPCRRVAVLHRQGGTGDVDAVARRRAFVRAVSRDHCAARHHRHRHAGIRPDAIEDDIAERRPVQGLSRRAASSWHPTSSRARSSPGSSSHPSSTAARTATPSCRRVWRGCCGRSHRAAGRKRMR